MAAKQTSSRQRTLRVAFCGMLTALSVVLMLLSGLIPLLLYAAPLAAGLLLLVVLIEVGRKFAWITWLATALCVLLLGVDKEAAFFYIFLGYYPIIKWDIDRLVPKKGLRVAVKLLFFTAVTALMYLLLSLLFPALALWEELAGTGLWMTLAFAVLMDLCMLIYDRMLLPLVALYDRRLRPYLKFLHR